MQPKNEQEKWRKQDKPMIAIEKKQTVIKDKLTIDYLQIQTQLGGEEVW